jgi:mRNA interferase RelE/StbE
MPARRQLHPLDPAKDQFGGWLSDREGEHPLQLSTKRAHTCKLLVRMDYRIRYAESVVKQLAKMSPDVARRIRSKIERLTKDLAGDVKRLTNYSPEYRLRVGDWRVLFNIDRDMILIERITHRSQAY